jgi:flavin-dependent thymidylate synthase
MKVHLAGYNVDTSILKQMEADLGKRQDLTPEVLSAAYARISRDPRSIKDIRKDAREEVEKSRRSNSAIIFKMGHHSVAEHAVFNLDIIGVSRLAMEEVEKFRLCSYTEKSQRYITLDNDFVLPGEIKGTKHEKIFIDMIKEQNKAYFVFFEKLKDHVFSKYADIAADPKKHNMIEGWAKEDARYITALATESQVGQTINARNLELMLRRFASSDLGEVKELGARIYDLISRVAPSIVIFHKANNKDLKTYPEIKLFCEKFTGEKSVPVGIAGGEEVSLVDYTGNGDDIVASSLMHTSSDLDYENCREIVSKLSAHEKAGIFKAAWRNTQFYDSMLREFEYVNLTYNICLSSACFGQLKRHRMATITNQEYDPSLGITVPASIKETGMEKYFRQITERTEKVFYDIKRDNPLAAPYILTNAHRKRVLIRVNARELYHISRLREDVHAQWDIRDISGKMILAAKKVMPLTFSLAGGKDKYNEVYKGLFGKLPDVTESVLPGKRKIGHAKV